MTERTAAKITDSARQKIAGLGPTDRVMLSLRLNDVHLWPQEEAKLHELGGTFFVQTSFIATVEVPVSQVEQVARLPTVHEIR